MSDDVARLAAAIRRARRDAGWTQKQLAEALGVKQSKVSRLETGEGMVSALALVAIQEALGCGPILPSQTCPTCGGEWR